MDNFILRALTKSRDRVYRHLLWNDATILDGLATISENTRLRSRLEKQHHEHLCQLLRSLDENQKANHHLLSELTAKFSAENHWEDKNKNAKHLEFALASYLISCKKITADPVNVIDVGAHRGLLTSLVSRVGGTVWAIEPHPELFKELQKKYCDHQQVHCLNYALSDHSGKGSLYLVANQTDQFEHLDLTLFSSLAKHTLPDFLKFKDEISVNLSTLDDLTEQNQIPDDIYFLKLDVEGFEWQVLNGMKNITPVVVCLEYWSSDFVFRNSRNTNTNQTILYMQNLGYSHFINIYQTPEMTSQTHETEFSDFPNSYGNIFFFRQSDCFEKALDWCQCILNSQ